MHVRTSSRSYSTISRPLPGQYTLCPTRAPKSLIENNRAAEVANINEGDEEESEEEE